MSLEVLYEDNHCIVVKKPAGVLVQGDETGDESLLDIVKQYLKEKYHKPGNVFLGLVHRLDRPVEGVIVFAKTSKGASRLSDQFRKRTVEKSYRAALEGRLPHDTGILENYLLKNTETNIVAVYDQPREGALFASLSYTIKERTGNVTLVDIALETGRPHQIRAQFGHIGHPIVGDKKYGATLPWKKGSIALCAWRLAFNHATTGERIVVEIDPFTYK